MNKDEITRIANRYSKKAQNNYMKYQESGVSRYLREYEHADDIASVCIMALSAADDHQAVGMYKSDMVRWAAKADHILRHYEEDDAVSLMKDIRGAAIARNLYSSPWKGER